MKIIAWIFGVGAMISLFCIYQQKSRKKLIIAKFCADVCWSVHYFCLHAYGGIVPNAVGIVRELVFMHRDDKKWANKLFIPVLFILANWCIGALTFSSPINILPIAASTFFTISLLLRKPQLTKIISIPVSLTFLIYDVFVGSYIGIVNESVAMLSILIDSIKNIHQKRRQQNDR